MQNDPISRYRRLMRAVTTRSGALDSSFLGLGRPLGTARVLNAIGHGREDLAELRAYLGLDSGLMSRLLRGLEAEGLIVTEASPKDARRRRATLTKSGRAEFERYESLSNEAAAENLTPFQSKPEALSELLGAMDRIATILGREQIEIHLVAPDDARLQHCVAAYYAEISEIFGTRFDPQVSGDPEHEALRPPNGAFLLALSDTLPVGCVALKGQGDELGEVKRLWVAPMARGLGLADLLMARIEDQAHALGMKRLQLDTNGKLTAARKLYAQSGWREIARYNDNPYAEHFFEKQLV